MRFSSGVHVRTCSAISKSEAERASPTLGARCEPPRARLGRVPTPFAAQAMRLLPSGVMTMHFRAGIVV